MIDKCVGGVIGIYWGWWLGDAVDVVCGWVATCNIMVKGYVFAIVRRVICETE